MANQNKYIKQYKEDKHLTEIKILEILNRFNTDYGVSLKDIKFKTSTDITGSQYIRRIKLDYKV